MNFLILSENEPFLPPISKHIFRHFSYRLTLRISYCVGPCQLLAENRAQVVSTQRLVAEGLGGILEKVARMQDNLQALAI